MGRDDRINRPGKQPGSLQFAELEGQHLLGDVPQLALDFAEPLGSAQQVPQKNELPFAAHQFHRQFQRAVVLRFDLLHAASRPLSIFLGTIG